MIIDVSDMSLYCKKVPLGRTRSEELYFKHMLQAILFIRPFKVFIQFLCEAMKSKKKETLSPFNTNPECFLSSQMRIHTASKSQQRDSGNWDLNRDSYRLITSWFVISYMEYWPKCYCVLRLCLGKSEKQNSVE